MENHINNLQKLQLDYQIAVDQFKMLADIRFKLLAFVPTLTGAAIAFLTETATHETALAVGFLGFIVTIGIIFYDIRNTQFYDAAVHRAKWLEALLELPVVTEPEPIPVEKQEESKESIGGLFNERPRQKLKFFRMIDIWHDRGLGLVYGSALGGWAFIIGNASLALTGYADYRIAMAIAAIVGTLCAWEYQHLSGSNKPKPNEKLQSEVKQKWKKPV